jgi:hypothetical protein
MEEDHITSLAHLVAARRMTTPAATPTVIIREQSTDHWNKHMRAKTVEKALGHRKMTPAG